MEIEEYQKLKQKVISQKSMVGKGLRFTNYIIDLIFVYVLLYIFFSILPFIVSESTLNILVELPYFIFFLLIALIYYVPLEFFTNRTLGKLVTGTYVVNVTGEKPSLSQIFGRTFSRLIPLEPISFLFDDRGWHDKLSKTSVIKIK